MNAERITKWISALSIALVFALTIGSFMLSYHALFEIALAYGVAPAFGWIWPLLVDGAIVVFALAVVRASLLKENTRLLWAMLIAFTAATIFFNILHSVTGFVSAIVALIAPAALVSSFETLMSNLRNHVQRSGIIHSIAELGEELAKKRQEMQQMIADKQTIADGLASQVDNLNQTIETLQGKLLSYNQDIEVKRNELKRLDAGQLSVYVPDNLSIEQRQELVRWMDNDGLTIGQMADNLKVSEGTIKNDKKAMKQAMNGQYENG